MDYEKLGVFYLGRQVDRETRQRADAPLLYPSADLVTHGVIVGMTGSGKTGLGIGLIEEAAIDGIPVLAIDPKGDLANLCLTFPTLTGEDFAPRVNEDAARLAGQTRDAFAEAQADLWRRGLDEWGQNGDRIARLREAADIVVYTPGSTAGRPISVMQSFMAPSAEVMADPDLMGDVVAVAATSVLALAGIDAEPLRSREHILLSTLFQHAWSEGRDLDLAALIVAVQQPPVTRVGVMDIDAFFPPKDRFALAMRLNQILAAPGFAAWLQGDPLDVQRLLYTAEGKPKVAVLSIAHLDDHERMFFVSLLLNEVVRWMRAQRGTTSLRALVYFDEIFGYLPPVANPPSKAPLLKLLKQARAFGIGLTLATQNPVDLDYKALSNCGTWMLGRLQTERDKARVLDGLEGVAASAGEGFDRAGLDQVLSGLGKRVFLLHNVHARRPTLFETRWTMAYLRGPMGREELRRLCATADDGSGTGPSDVGTGRGAPAASSAASSEAAPAPAGRGGLNAAFPNPGHPLPSQGQSTTPPVLPPGIPQFFLDAPEGARLEPVLLGVARVAVSDAKLGIDESSTLLASVPIDDGPVPVDWERAERLDCGTDALQSVPPSGVSFAPLPSVAQAAKRYPGWEKGFATWVAQTQGVTLFRSGRTKLASVPGESEGAFRVRVGQALREGRDAAVARLEDKYAARLRTAEDKVRRAEAAVQRESLQARDSSLSAAVSVGAGLLSAIFGGKALSGANVGRAATAIRGAGRAQSQAADVQRAQAQVTLLRQQADDIQAALQRDVAQIQAEWDPTTDVIETVTIRPKRGGVTIQVCGVLWGPATGTAGR
jgi:hypothetical protein